MGRKTYITPDDVEANIAISYTVRADHAVGFEGAHGLDKVTLCVLVLRNGTKVVGVNYGAIDPARHCPERGKEEARKHAYDQVWQLMGYELRSELANA